MARQLRIQYPGAVYHVTCRGNEQRKIFLDDEDRMRFLRILAQSLNIYSAKLYAFVLMDNHFHVLLETPLGNLSEIMRHFNISYTGYFNRRHKRVGHLYQGRYKSILVEKEAYLSVLSRYIHLNPIRLKKLQKSSAKEKLEKLLNYSWSSLPVYIETNKGDGMIDCTLVLADYGGDTEKGRKAYLKQLFSDIDAGFNVNEAIFGQSILGGEGFIHWVKETFLGESETREQPSVGKIKNYQHKETILELIEKETGKDLETLRKEKGSLRRMAIDLLYRFGGLKGPEVGALMGIDYTAVSQERKRLREAIAQDRELKEMMARLENCLSTSKI
ncbi:MAG: transposase [Desulfuromonadales bacterium]|nr:transposase [Desulfuromonadales bacterium]